MGKKIGKFIKYVMYTVCGSLVIFTGMVVYEMKSMENERDTVNTENVVTKEYTKEDVIETDSYCWDIITETEKSLNNLIEISGQYDNGTISKNDMYTLADKVHKFAQNKKADLRGVDISSETEYKRMCNDYITTTITIADSIKVYLDENKQQALTDAKDFMVYNTAIAESIVTERIAYLLESGLSEEDIQAITSIE